MSEAKRERKPPEIGGYVIEAHLGQGGMGDVWKARQEGTNRTVAIKMIRSMELPDEIQMARFQLEAELIAHVQDPNIVQIFHTGKIGERPYLVMEFVGGGTLADGMTDRAFEPQEAARLIETLALAIGKVHRKGIVHRDLKPSNILIDEAGAPKIADFGLARLSKLPTSDQSRGMVIGTPGYMSPEQILGANPVLTVASETDIFALGVILYQLLTGQHPFQADSDYEAKKLACNAEPKSPRLIRREVPRDLEAICLKCLEKKRVRRYPDGVALAEDLERFLQDRPTLARPIGGGGRAWRWCLRNPLATGLIALALVGSALAVAYGIEMTRRRQAELKADAESARALAQSIETRAAREIVAEQQKQAEINAYFGRINDIKREIDACHLIEAERLLEACPPSLRDWEWNQLKHRLHSERLRVRIEDARGTPVNRRGLPLEFSQDGSRLVVAHGLSVDAGERSAAEPSTPLTIHLESVGNDGGIVSSDGSLSASFRGMTNPPYQINVRRWKTVVLPDSTRQTLHDVKAVLAGHTGEVLKIAFSRDSRQLVSISKDQTIRVWDLETGREIRRLDLFDGNRCQLITANLAFSPDGKTIACLVWSDRQTMPALRPSEEEARDLIVWDLAANDQRYPGTVVERAKLGMMVPYVTDADDVVFSPNGALLAYAASNRTIRVVMGVIGREIRTYAGHPVAQPNGFAGVKLAFFPKGTRLASGGSDHLVKVWNFQANDAPDEPGPASNDDFAIRPDLVLPAHEFAISAVAISPDGRSLATSDSLDAKLWDLDRVMGALKLDLRPAQATVFAVDPSGNFLAVGVEGSSFQFCDLATGRAIATVSLPEAESMLRISAMAFCDGGKTLAVGLSPRAFTMPGIRGLVQFWDVKSRKLVWTGPGQKEVKALVVGPDGRQVFSAGGDQLDPSGDLWRLDSVAHRGIELALPEFTRALDVVASPKTGDLWIIEEHKVEGPRAIRVDPATNQVLSAEAGVLAMAIDPQGLRMVRAKVGGRIEVVDLRTGTVEASASFPGRTFRGLAINREGTRLASWSTFQSAEEVPTAILWELRGLREVLTLSGFTRPIDQAVFSLDGHLLISRESGGTIRVWDGTPTPDGSKPSIFVQPGKPRDGKLP
jgi:eukaryotic-like serine/threonine-protein kinase